MQTIPSLAKDFLSQKRIAVVGISSTRQTVGNGVYKKLKQGPRFVYAVGKHTTSFENDQCYADLASLPTPVDGVFIAVTPEQSEEVVEECVRLGIRRVWMHCMGGTSTASKLNHGSRSTSVSSRAVQLCRDNNIAVIPGACPMMFVEDADFFHRLIRRFHSLTGRLRIV